MPLKNQSAIENNNAFKIKIEDLIKEILVQNGIPYYRIESRMEFTGLHEEDSYRPLIRVITYFEDTVGAISELLLKEFDLANVRSLDKKGLRVDTFSYKHVQYLANLRADRQGLTEYKRSADKKFEIQVCSMLQDAWVGIERELGYESASIPDEVKRDFYRVGALLEMADLEFLKIRSQLGKRATGEPTGTTFAEHLQAVVSEAPVAPVYVAPPEPVKPVVAAAIPLSEQLKKATPEVPKIELEAMDMNVDKFSSMAMNVNHVEEKNGVTEEALAGLVNLGATAVPLAITPEEQHKEAPPVAPIVPEAEAAPAANGDGVALNIDNIQTFNMNVNGMIEKTTEIIRENGGAPVAEKVPFYNEEPKPVVEAPVDENSPMTDAALRDYVLNSRALKEVDMQIAERAGAKLNAEIDIEGDVDRLKFLKVYTLKQLHERIVDNSADIVAFAEKWIGKDNGGSFDSGICLFYLEYLLVGKKNDPAFAIEYVVKFISDNDYSARYIIPTYNSIRNAEPASHAHLTLK